jgi:apolipoprotein N-acyltransferase
MVARVESADGEALGVASFTPGAAKNPRASPPSRRTKAVLFVWPSAVVLFAVLLGGTRPWEDLLLLSLLVATTGGGKRSVAFVSTVFLSWAGSPALNWPTYLFCLTPLAWAWRTASPRRWRAWEAFLVGFVMAWTGGAFMRDGMPSLVPLSYVAGCCLFGLQWVVIAATLSLTSGHRPLRAALAVASVATTCEVLQAVYGLPWIFMALALPAANGPLAQWAHWLTIFGVSFLLYLINFLWPLDRWAVGLRRWRPPLAAAALLGLGWAGGLWIARGVEVRPLPFTAILVQPRGAPGAAGRWGDEPPLDESLRTLTRSALSRAQNVDLVVWPESSYSGLLYWPEPPPWAGAPPPSPETKGGGHPGHVTDWRDGACRLGEDPSIATARNPPSLLLGATVVTGGPSRHNSACLVAPRGGLSRYDKLKLVPLTEGIPSWLDFNSLRQHVWPLLGVEGRDRPGDFYHPLTLETGNGSEVNLGISICYEMYFPWLPQYQSASTPDAIIHLANESWARGAPALARYENMACQYRAIETRRWQLLCTMRGNSAVIDPRGVIVNALHGRAGVIRTTPIPED